MTWRYQPVWQEEGLGLRSYSLIEVYFEEDGHHLRSWQSDPGTDVGGGDMREMALTLTLMLRDALRWEPVAYELLHAGMVFAERTD